MRYEHGQVVARRVREASPKAPTKVTVPEHAAAFWREEIAKAPDYTPDQERFVVVHLNTRHAVIGWHLVSLGTVNSCAAVARDVFRAAIVNNAYKVVLLHNHPSGEVDPSNSDIKISRKLERAGRVMEIDVLDSIIVGTNPDVPSVHASLREQGLMGGEWVTNLDELF